MIVPDIDLGPSVGTGIEFGFVEAWIVEQSMAQVPMAALLVTWMMVRVIKSRLCQRLDDGTVSHLQSC